MSASAQFPADYVFSVAQALLDKIEKERLQKRSEMIAKLMASPKKMGCFFWRKTVLLTAEQAEEEYRAHDGWGDSLEYYAERKFWSRSSAVMPLKRIASAVLQSPVAGKFVRLEPADCATLDIPSDFGATA